MRFVRKQANKSKVCRLLGVNRSSVYYRRKGYRETELDSRVVSIFEAHNGVYGCPRIKIELNKLGCTVSKRRIGKILKRHGLASKHGRRKLAKNIYTAPKERYIADNLIKGSKATVSNAIWQMDYTEFRCKDGKLYVDGIIDVYDKTVVITDSLKADSKMNETTLKKAVAQKGKPQILHTDRGSTYISKYLREVIEQLESVRHSMSAPHSPNENQYIESFWKTLKTEIGPAKHFTRAELKQVLHYYIDYYNHTRIHSSIGYATPSAYRLQYELAHTANHTAT